MRRGVTIRAVQRNAQCLLALKAEPGSGARCFAGWPATDQVDRLAVLQARRR